MTKICFFIPNIYPLIAGFKEGFGGAELDIYNLASRLSIEDDTEIRIVCITKDLEKEKYFEKILITPIKPYLPVKTKRGKWLAYILRVLRTFFSLDSEFYLFKIASLEAIIALFAAKIRGKKTIYRMAHDWETDEEDLRNKVFSGRSWLAKLFIFSLKRVDLVISQTKKQAELLQKNFNINSTTISNAHYIPELREESKFSILWVGRAHPMKRPEVLLKLAKSFKDERFVMVMSPNKEYEHIYRNIEEKAGKINNINFIGGVRYDEVDKYFRTAKVFVLTSEIEGQSNVLIEALKTRTPVVSLNVDPDGILMNNKIGFCADGDFNKMVEYMNSILRDRGMWQQYSDRAYKFAKENFNVNKTAAKYEEIMKTL